MSYADFIKLQNYVGLYLASFDALDRINIVTRERLLTLETRLPDENLAIEVLAYTTPREGGEGRTGAGVVIEKPGFAVRNPNLPGPEGELTLELLVLEDPLTNNGPSEGTGLPADQISQIIMDALHWQQFEGFGQMFCDANAMSEAREFQPLVAYRLRFRCRMQRTQSEKVAQPSITEDAGLVTLTCATPDAQIYFTTNGTFPGSGNPAATIYAEPFAVSVGDVVNVCAYAVGMTPSHMIQATIT